MIASSTPEVTTGDVMSYVTNSRMLGVTLALQIRKSSNLWFCEDFDMAVTFGAGLTPV